MVETEGLFSVESGVGSRSGGSTMRPCAILSARMAPPIPSSKILSGNVMNKKIFRKSIFIFLGSHIELCHGFVTETGSKSGFLE